MDVHRRNLARPTGSPNQGLKPFISSSPWGDVGEPLSNRPVGVGRTPQEKGVLRHVHQEVPVAHPHGVSSTRCSSGTSVFMTTPLSTGHPAPVLVHLPLFHEVLHRPGGEGSTQASTPELSKAGSPTALPRN